MKKPFLFIALLSGSISLAQAQTAIPAGTISLGGSIGYNRTSNESENTVAGNTYSFETSASQFFFSPSVGYFLADNLALGLNLGYTAASSKTTNTGPGVTSPNSLDARTTLQIGPYVQYYKMISDQFGVLGTLGAGYLHSFTPSRAGSSSSTVIETTSSGFYTGLTPGVIFFPVPKFGISASIGSLGYQRVSVEDSNDSDDESNHSSSFGASFGLSQLQFGGTFYFGR